MATDWISLLPFLSLAGGGTLIFLVGAFWQGRPQSLLFALALLTALAAGVVFLLPYSNPGFEGMLDLDGYSRFFSLLLIFITLITLLFMRQYSLIRGFSGDELYALLIFAVLGMVLVVSSANWVIFFLGLELLSLSLYVLIAINKGEPYGNEAALKYFIMGAVASAFLTFGLALLYAMTGTLQIAASLAAAQSYPEQLSVILLALALVLTGMGFKISLVPFHLWTPDVYQGSPAPITAFLSTGSKVALFAALLRFAWLAAPLVWDYAWPVLWVLALLTMAVGNLTALYQTKVKRLLAYSSIAQMGYLFMTLVAVKDGGLPAIMFYLAVYAIMDLGAFGLIGSFSGGDTHLEELSDYQGLGYTHPWRAAILAVCLISLLGLPPTAGFMGKLVLFRAVLNANFITLAVLGMLTAIISVYYYINFVIHLYMHERGPGIPVPGVDPGIGLAGALILAAILWLGILPDPLLQAISAIAAALPKPV
ncbi:MAG: NADH-quinone oxidoreductase subunit N [Thermodesulfobacteriota bacterium]